MIKTERLFIRRIKSEDWSAIQAIWIDEALSQYAQFDKPNHLDSVCVQNRIEKWASYEESNEHIFWAICLYNMVIGYVAFNKNDDYYEMGYCFHSDYHGYGYAKESISALLNYMREKNINRIVARTAIKNKPSVKLLDSIGFKQKGLEKVSFYQDKAGNSIFFEGGIFEILL